MPNEIKFEEMLEKAASLTAGEVTDADLRAINKYTLSPVTAEQVFVFKAALCDNETDRQYERFSLKALEDMRRLYLGKTVIKDHYRSADNQIARIYATELSAEAGRVTESGETYTQLIAKCYMVRTASNADLITEIQGGIKKEGSVGFRAGSALCSICGTDNASTYCPHWPGRKYKKDTGEAVCTFLLSSVTDAYEFSLVAVPAQRAAGARKAYTGTPAYAPAEEPETVTLAESSAPAAEAEKYTRLTALRARAAKNHAKNMEEE